MEKYISKLIFNKYIVNKVIFNNNENYDSNENVKINFRINKKTKKDNNSMKIELTTIIFKDAVNNNYPFEMEITVTGYFSIENKEEKIDFEPNAIAILYPYVRAIVSTYTASANINPLILPAINVNKLIEDQEKKTKQKMKP